MEIVTPLSAGGKIARNDKILVVPRGATLPALCVKCGEPAEGSPIEQTYYWHNPWLYLLVLVNLIVYAIVAMIVRKKMPLEVPVCTHHRDHRRNLLLVGLSLLIICIPIAAGIGTMIGGDNGLGVGVLVWFAVFTAGVVFLALRPLLRPTYIDENGGKFKGAGGAFLERLTSEGITPTA